jgi:hypothetical protein
MKRIPFSISYMLRTSRLDMVWLPGGFLALFIILTLMTRSDANAFALTTSYFGVALPLISGILAAYAILDDPALELQFAAPRPVWSLLVERLGANLTLMTLCALLYQAVMALIGVDLSPLGPWLLRQLAWLAPTLAMMGLGAAATFLLRQSTGGAALIGLLWLIQLIVHDWFLSSPWGQYLLLMMGSNYYEHPALRSNQAALSALAAALLFGAWQLLRREEHYL